METEIWKDIAGYEGLYQISNMGRVKSLSRLDTRNNNVKERILVLSNHHRQGYVMIGLSKNSITKKKLLHRLVAIAFISNPDGKEQVNHINGIKWDNKASNLEWNTSAENVAHSFSVGLKSKSLNDTDVTNIISLIKENVKPYRIWRDLYPHTNIGNIYAIKHNKAWKHIPR